MKSLLLLVMLGNGSSIAVARDTKWLDCGRTNFYPRIVEGKETFSNEYPWMASLKIRGKHRCGASLISPWHALTAAHCVIKVLYPNSLHLLLGAHNIKFDKEGLLVPIMKFVAHERFNELRTSENDIAILVTKWEIPFSEVIGPVCLPTRPLHLEGRTVTLTGWGTIYFKGPLSDVLLEVNLQVISKQLCYYLLRKPWDNHLEKKLCTIARHGGSCQGDSGGPVVWFDPETNRFTQAAIVSYGWGCAGPTPSINTDVSAYIGWIKYNIQATTPHNFSGRFEEEDYLQLGTRLKNI